MMPATDVSERTNVSDCSHSKDGHDTAAMDAGGVVDTSSACRCGSGHSCHVQWFRCPTGRRSDMAYSRGERPSPHTHCDTRKTQAFQACADVIATPRGSRPLLFSMPRVSRSTHAYSRPCVAPDAAPLSRPARRWPADLNPGDHHVRTEVPRHLPVRPAFAEPCARRRQPVRSSAAGHPVAELDARPAVRAAVAWPVARAGARGMSSAPLSVEVARLPAPVQADVIGWRISRRPGRHPSAAVALHLSLDAWGDLSARYNVGGIEIAGVYHPLTATTQSYREIADGARDPRITLWIEPRRIRLAGIDCEILGIERNALRDGLDANWIAIRIQDPIERARLADRGAFPDGIPGEYLGRPITAHVLMQSARWPHDAIAIADPSSQVGTVTVTNADPAWSRRHLRGETP